MIWYVAAFIAFFVKGLCGFANTLVFTSILSFSINNINISPIDLVLGIPSNFLIAYKERKHIQWKLVLLLFSLILLGSIPGMILLKNTDTTVIKIIFGFVVVGIGIEMLLREVRQSNKDMPKIVLFFIGVLSGLLCGLYGIGALLSAYISRVTEDSHGFKGNMCMVFSLENVFRIILYSILGIITADVLYRALTLVPVMLVALFLGMQVSKRINEKNIKKVVIFMLILSGIMLIIKSL